MEVLQDRIGLQSMRWYSLSKDDSNCDSGSAGRSGSPRFGLMLPLHVHVAIPIERVSHSSRNNLGRDTEQAYLRGQNCIFHAR